MKANITPTVSSADEPDDPRFSAIRAAIFGDLIDKPTFAKAIKRSLRSVDRLMAAGLPHYSFNGCDWINPPEAHQWIMSRPKTRDRSPRGRGRPRNDGRRRP